MCGCRKCRKTGPLDKLTFGVDTSRGTFSCTNKKKIKLFLKYIDSIVWVCSSLEVHRPAAGCRCSLEQLLPRADLSCIGLGQKIVSYRVYSVAAYSIPPTAFLTTPIDLKKSYLLTELKKSNKFPGHSCHILYLLNKKMISLYSIHRILHQ